MNSKDYWAQREEEQLKHNITEEKEYDREIKRIYSNMLDACQKEINSFYGKYAAAEGISLAEAKKRVSKLDIAEYERKAKKYVKEKDFSPQANEEMRIYNATMKINRLEMLKANIGLETIAGHDELDKYMSGILKGRTEAELKRQAGILGKTIKNNAAKADSIVNGSFHSGTFSDRIWQYQDLMRTDLSKLLQSGLIQGKNPRALAKDLKKYWYGADPKTGGGATYCMERLMRTELARVQTEAQKQSFIRNGFDEYEFIANADCCDICKGINGKHFKVSKMMPGENAPPMHPHCRCSTAAYSDDAEYEAWLDHLANGGTTEEWNERITAGNSNGTSKDVLTNAVNGDKIVSGNNKFKKITNDHTIADDIGTSNVPVCNPKFKTGGIMYQNNCGYCAATYEMRRRGFDVIANPKNGMSVVDWMRLFKGSKPIALTSTRTAALVPELQTKLSSLGNGARGSIYVDWKGNQPLGHFFSWEVEDGVVRFVDGQNGEADVTHYFEIVKPTKTICVRWDDLEPSDMIEDACKNRGGA